MLTARTVNHHFPLIITSLSLPIKDNLDMKKKETQQLESIEISNFFLKLKARSQQSRRIT